MAQHFESSDELLAINPSYPFEHLLSIHYILLALACLLLLSLVATKASGRTGVPALLVFLVIGILAGMEGVGGVNFDDTWIAQSMGVVALAFILFVGGLETHWSAIRGIIWRGLSLSTIGSLTSAILVGLFLTHVVGGFGFLEAILFGAIVSSTDAAAVFAVLRTNSVELKGSLSELVELESGSNDPMAVFLTAGIIGLLVDPTISITSLIPSFFIEMSVGGVMGFLLGRVIVFTINRLRLEHEGLYPVLTFALVLLAYSLPSAFHGNGYLAVYIAGVVVGSHKFFHKRSLIRFHSGLGWLMQIMMFLTLGLLVTPSELVPVIPKGLSVSAFLIFVARPASVFFSLAFSDLGWREKLLISWMGLRGAVPIVLATFPLIAGISQANTIFNLVFFTVVVSVLVQGSTIAYVARWLGLNAPASKKSQHTVQHGPAINEQAQMTEVLVPYHSGLVGETIMSLGLPEDGFVMLISREEGTLVPNGRTRIEAGDVLMVLATPEALHSLEIRLYNPEKPVRESKLLKKLRGMRKRSV
ncbi:MAG TPA: potassium/proton antiporter [Candidatus Kapabacteria bacterium]|nr:potassium/proton antiporter [Candidatus Kapabacteria bacterium]